MPHIRLHLPSAPCTTPGRQRNTINEDKTLQSSAVPSSRVCVCVENTLPFINVHIRSSPDAIGEPAGRTCLFLHPTTKSHPHPFRKRAQTCSHAAALSTVQLGASYKNDGDRWERLTRRGKAVPFSCKLLLIRIILEF